MRKGSGKQVLLKILKDLSTTKLEKEEDFKSATNKLRTGMLMHISTDDDAMIMAKEIQWSSKDKGSEVQSQGIAIQNGTVFLTDFFEIMMDMPGLKEYMKDNIDGLTDEQLLACDLAMWSLISAVQMSSRLLEVEINEEDLDIEDWTKKITRHFNNYWEDKNKA